VKGKMKIIYCESIDIKPNLISID